ncbi:MAG: DUF177 domain-containing protein [Candidatus Nitronauta litoralis]|uniref:DUF177 domain-containing protein n=1 Tax=Candidatus Nitronauta litoralis TaxID=2705533 RepID=A0A7T0G1D8_9BACT|nr:MAG: DUF177 domain-containing protein [Candidatus Nitronauta litoralis]
MTLKIEIESIPEDTGLEFNQTLKRDSLEIDQPDCCLTRDIELSGKFNRIGREVFFQGQVDTEIQFLCSRCLEKYEIPVKTPVNTCFMPAPENQPQEEHELRASDIELEYYRENTIDLAQPVFDQILLTQPLIPLCDPDCQGLCPQCGINRNLESCQCQKGQDLGDPRFEVLQKLKDKLK